MTTPKHDQSGAPTRRDFLKTIAVAGGAAAVGLGTGAAVAEVRERSEAGPAERDAVYRETPHIKDYYAKAHF